MKKHLILVIYILISSSLHATTLTPEIYHRSEDQTYLTYPEWFLVFSPEEYAEFIKNNQPSEFPYLGHIKQFWKSYKTIYENTKGKYPFNLEYHIVVSVIGSSTTVEYGLKWGYELLVGRTTEWLKFNQKKSTPEEEYAAEVARDYVDFIYETPWYEYPFFTKLKNLWTRTPLTGPNMLRKWERKYCLTTEYLIKGLYGSLIKWATKASFTPPTPRTVIIAKNFNPQRKLNLPKLEMLAEISKGVWMLSLPRYQPFTNYAKVLSKEGIEFLEVCGNKNEILLCVTGQNKNSSKLVQDKNLLLQLQILTRKDSSRFILSVPIRQLNEVIIDIENQNYFIEHIYDF